ncbi:hypothetical protein [Asticcacaulis sp. YBE204]|uniref:hypothetical protein n=1 Tax=Asticcacaulis sp. YBE204 TaxID=1282363 RepID=UPI0003C3EABC|nr:hypothetical protein [Asticcacaulis sp. YBE204]ESQ78508.1 hypothetical protein AEYBE204_13230 [Asticcacaulis sp. YBE204]
MKLFTFLFTFAALAFAVVSSPLFLPRLVATPVSEHPMSVLAYLIAVAVLIGLSIAAAVYRSNVLAKVYAVAFQAERQAKAYAA